MRNLFILWFASSVALLIALGGNSRPVRNPSGGFGQADLASLPPTMEDEPDDDFTDFSIRQNRAMPSA
ncbi:MAG: hypothetical protein P4N41_24715 [Negativicutes bacterium]|nr:hypothetical protein [Negativicutes bacterium]MDR3592874.1 hypothetical protein [Negativicutes bacterium]